jgi:hypothetical protein
VYNASQIVELKEQNEVVKQVSFSNMAYSLVLTADGNVFEIGFSAEFDCLHTSSMSSLQN